MVQETQRKRDPTRTSGANLMSGTSTPDRYSRQTLFGPIGKDGQKQLGDSSVAIIGCGALGTVIANNLCRAGIGRLVIADRDYIELNNLQRQILFDEEDIARRLPKAIAAAEKLHRVNSTTKIEALVEDINADGIESLVQNVDLVLDATDNFETRYLLNDACVKYGRPWIYNAVIASYGVTMNIIPGDTPCLRCIFPEIPLPGTTPTCDTAGVLNGIVGAISGVATTEALKLLLQSDKVSRAMFWMDVWENTSERIELPRQLDCPTCGLHQYEFLDSLNGTSSASLCGRNAVQVRSGRKHDKINLPGLAERLRPAGQVSFNEFLLRFIVDDYELTIFPDARAIIKGTDDVQVALSVYSRYIGM
jgi:molybdopterin/thiamine biosynthesis adenylyltransferase